MSFNFVKGFQIEYLPITSDRTAYFVQPPIADPLCVMLPEFLVKGFLAVKILNPQGTSEVMQ